MPGPHGGLARPHAPANNQGGLGLGGISIGERPLHDGIVQLLSGIRAGSDAQFLGDSLRDIGRRKTNGQIILVKWREPRSVSFGRICESKSIEPCRPIAAKFFDCSGVRDESPYIELQGSSQARRRYAS